MISRRKFLKLLGLSPAIAVVPIATASSLSVKECSGNSKEVIYHNLGYQPKMVLIKRKSGWITYKTEKLEIL